MCLRVKFRRHGEIKHSDSLKKHRVLCEVVCVKREHFYLLSAGCDVIKLGYVRVENKWFSSEPDLGIFVYPLLSSFVVKQKSNRV